MNFGDTFLAGVGLLATLVAGIFALHGWLLPVDDSIRRFTSRYIACGAWFVAADAAICQWGPWWQTALAFVWAIYASSRCSHWWRKAEGMRKAKRDYLRATGRTL